MRGGLAWTLGMVRALGIAPPLVVALALVVAPARAWADESLVASGSITYTWQGDPAHGCAAAGLCGVHGALVVQAAGSTTAQSFGGGAIDIAFFGSSGTVRVAGPGGDCVDVPGGLFGGDLFLVRVRGKLVGQIQPAPSSGRCAGPLQRDFARLTLPVKRSGGKHPSFDLRTIRSFKAGPFSGKLVSTLRLRHASGGGGFSTSSSGSSSGSSPATPTHKFLLEQVTLGYRLAGLPGTLDAAFSGVPNPFCGALDSCGTSGNLALSVGSFQNTFVATASRVVARRVSPRQALADMRRGRLSFGSGGLPLSPPFLLLFGSGGLPLSPPFLVPTALSETFRAPDATQCQAASSSRAAELQIDSASGTRPRPGLEVSLSDSGNPSLLRTYCPGPNDTDVFGRSPFLLSASVGPAQLLLHHSVVSLSRSGGFAGPGYVGTRAGALGFSLTLEHVHAGTIESSGALP